MRPRTDFVNPNSCTPPQLPKQEEDLMQCRSTKFPRVRLLALAVGLVVMASLSMASSSFAGAPATGTACQADGKISGRGATFQTKAQVALIQGYRVDVCGPVGAAPSNNMIEYNYTGAPNGSGQGQIATSCRTDAFGGTDIPYDQNTLDILNLQKGADIPGQAAPYDVNACAQFNASAPPFSPNSGPYPNANDQIAPVMSFPVAGSAVAIGVHFDTPGPGKVCTGGSAPTSIRFSPATVSKIFAGEATNWNDPAILADNPTLNATCTGPIARVVRDAKSGTTQIFKNMLQKVDGSRALCGTTGQTWSSLAQDANNIVWPTTGCAANLNPKNGGGGVASFTAGKDGGIGYADLPDWFSSCSPTCTVRAGAVVASIQQASGGTYVSPRTNNQANCVAAFASASLPGSTIDDAVGMGSSGTNWATDASPVRADVTAPSTGYPICGLTFDFVFSGLSDTSGGATNAISRLTPNQRRTLYSYFTYVFSPAGQSTLQSVGYDSLPTVWLNKLRLGFQGNF